MNDKYKIVNPKDYGFDDIRIYRNGRFNRPPLYDVSFSEGCGMGSMTLTKQQVLDTFPNAITKKLVWVDGDLEKDLE